MTTDRGPAGNVWPDAAGLTALDHAPLAPADLDHEGLESLSRTECLALLASAGLGRIALTVGALPVIVPVPYLYDGRHVLFCTATGTTLDRATHDTVVAFQTDGVEAGSGAPWSVSVVGVAHHVTEDETPVDADDLLPSWSTSPSHRFVAISTERLSGQRARS